MLDTADTIFFMMSCHLSLPCPIGGLPHCFCVQSIQKWPNVFNDPKMQNVLVYEILIDNFFHHVVCAAVHGCIATVQLLNENWFFDSIGVWAMNVETIWQNNGMPEQCDVGTVVTLWLILSNLWDMGKMDWRPPTKVVLQISSISDLLDWLTLKWLSIIMRHDFWVPCM